MTRIEFIPETGSTNADLLNRLRAAEPLPEGTWLVADRQTSGRGRQGRAWQDGMGNFMGSVVIRPGAGDPGPGTLAFVAGLAVYEAVASCVANPSGLMLKWPNDLLWHGAKLAGILLEQADGAIVAGIGVNLAYAPELPDRVTVALADHGVSPDRDIFAHALAEAMANELQRWRHYGQASTITRWQVVAHPLGTPLRVQVPGQETIAGTFAGLQADGALRLRLADGSSRAIHAGDVFV